MSGGADRRCRYKGVRRRRWGKWVSEIRVPGTRERLWLGSYAAPEAAAVAHDAAACLLRGHGAGTTAGRLLNFPDRVACYAVASRGRPPMSPRSVQRVASDAGMAADAQLLEARERASPVSPARPLVDRVGIGIARCGGHDEREHWPYAATAGSDSAGIASATATSWGTAPRSDGSRSSSADAACELERRLVYGDISVDDIDILM